MRQRLHFGLQMPCQHVSHAGNDENRNNIGEKNRQNNGHEGLPARIFCFNWPQALETSLPRFLRMNVAVPLRTRISWNRKMVSFSALSNGISSAGFKGIRLTFTRIPRSNSDSLVASSSESVTPLIMTHSNITRFCRTAGRFRTVSITASTGYLRLIGISVSRVTLVIPVSDMERFGKSGSLARRTMPGMTPAVETVIRDIGMRSP